MITAWIVYAIVVGSLLSVSGLALERFLRTQGLPSRWIWAGIIFLSIGWPLGHWALENRPQHLPSMVVTDLPLAAGQPAPTTFLPIAPIVVEVPQESVLRLLDGPILIGWALSTGALLLFFAFLVLRTHRLSGRWRRERAGGQPVLISDEWGPAVVGFLRPQIVLPGWCREIDAWALQFILDHELEHIRAGDLKLTILAGLFPVLFPWHLPLWWQLARLRTAVEGDCDLRVLGRNPGLTKPYVDLLLEVGERSSRTRPFAAMLSEPYETLKRRIKIMTMPRRPWIRGGLLVSCGGLLVAAACLAPGPTDGQSTGPEAVVGAEVSENTREAPDQVTPPTFTPFVVIPAFQNREEVVATLVRDYPADLREAGSGGTVNIWFFVDEEGTVQRTLINETSGLRALDDAAIRVANIIEFLPALNRDQPRPVWVSLPIEFLIGDDPQVEGAADRSVAVGSGGSTVAHQPVDESLDLLPTGEISGTITDAATGQPLGSVQVVVAGTRVGTLANQEGRFLIQQVPVGEREVIALLIGHGRQGMMVSVTEGESVDVDFQLRATAIALDPLVVRITS